MTPRFSLLMCSYNNSRYIDDAIRSVLAQTFADWELIIVDDASSDDSLDRIKAYLSDPRIRLYAREMNSGYTRSLIFGLSKVSSGIVGIIDSDDALVPQAVEKVFGVYTERPDVGVVLSQTHRCGPNLEPLYVFSGHRTEPLLWLKGGTHFRTFKLAAYNKTSGFDPRILHAEDWDLVIKLEEVAPAYRIAEPLYMYRFDSTSVSQAPESHIRGFRSLALALYAAHLRRLRTTLPKMPRQAVLAWMVAAVEYSLDLREPWRALVFALRGLRVLPSAPASWRTLAKAGSACLKLAGAWSRMDHSGFDMLRSYPVRGVRVVTGNVEADRVVCIPLVHREGYCLQAGEYFVPQTGQYSVSFEISIEPYSFAENPLVILDVYDNLQTSSVLAERRIESEDLAGSPRSFDVEFHAMEGQRLEFRIYWKEQCFASATKVVLRKA
jgi:glycosyltransferase involved in cell wall biosynthesis